MELRRIEDGVRQPVGVVGQPVGVPADLETPEALAALEAGEPGIVEPNEVVSETPEAPAALEAGEHGIVEQDDVVSQFYITIAENPDLDKEWVCYRNTVIYGNAVKGTLIGAAAAEAAIRVVEYVKSEALRDEDRRFARLFFPAAGAKLSLLVSIGQTGETAQERWINQRIAQPMNVPENDG